MSMVVDQLEVAEPLLDGFGVRAGGQTVCDCRVTQPVEGETR